MFTIAPVPSTTPLLAGLDAGSTTLKLVILGPATAAASTTPAASAESQPPQTPPAIGHIGQIGRISPIGRIGRISPISAATPPPAPAATPPTAPAAPAAPAATPLIADYRRHKADIPGTLAAMLADAAKILGENTTLSLVVTGSAGLGLADAFHLPFMQESIAAAAMARHFHPDTRTLVDIGGEDAKMIFFAPGHAPDIRMNGSCAGGTGAFLDQIATLLNCEAENLDALATAAANLHPVASRCGVFAKTDIQNLLARNVSPADIAASAFRAVAQQIVSTLARGRDIEAPVLFCGGPLAHIAHLRDACTTALGVNPLDCVLPGNAALVPALGCAIAPGIARATVRLGELRQWATTAAAPLPIASAVLPVYGKGASHATASSVPPPIAARQVPPPAPSSTDTLAPLFATPADYQTWRARKERLLPIADFATLATDECWLGVDSGSTTTKIVALAPAGLLFSHYAPNNGNPLEAVRAGLEKFQNTAAAAGHPALRIRRAAVTGYGEDLLKAAFGFEAGVVETMAHYSAARSLEPAVSFLLDIGGQDMKAVFIENHAIVRLDINEACSSGCGSFMDTFARSLGLNAATFAALACEATRPCDLGTRCTVFMNSKVKQAQRENATRADIAAGLAYSVAKNCLYKVLKLKSTADLGPRIVVQGGTMRNHAVVRAFELLAGLDITVAPLPELMGAYGAALHARTTDPLTIASAVLPVHGEGAPPLTIASAVLPIYGKGTPHATASSESPPIAARQEPPTTSASSTATTSTAPTRLLSDLARPRPHDTADTTCPGCENRCLVRKHTFANGNTFFAGNKCEKIFTNRGTTFTRGANFHAFKQKLLWDRPAEIPTPPAATPPPAAPLTIGIPRALGFYENHPFWHALLTHCGLRVAVSTPSTFKLYGQGARSIMSDNICFPAKLVHGHVLNLVSRKVDRILMPFIIHEQLGTNGGGAGIGSGSTHAYNCPIVTGYSDVIRSALDTATKHNIPLDAPVLTFADPALLRAGCRDYITKTLRLPRATFETAFDAALAAQENFATTLANKAREIVQQNANANTAAATARPLIVLAGRPYHNDPLIQHKVADMFSDLGADVISEDIARAETAPTAGANSSWAYPNRIFAAAAWVCAAPPNVHFVQITSFGCGPDAFIIDEVGDRLRRAGKSHTVLKVDDINNPGSLRLRARSLLESLSLRTTAAPAAAAAPAAQSTPPLSPAPATASAVQCSTDNPVCVPVAAPAARGMGVSPVLPAAPAAPSPAPSPCPSVSVRVSPCVSVSPPTTPPFTLADRHRRTILVPYFSEFYSPYIPILMRLMGYKSRSLPPPDAASINHGLQYSNNEICYPATLVIGDFIRELKTGTYDHSEIALGITQTGGQCRATSYLALIKKALLAAGYADIPVVAFGTNVGAAANDQPGFKPDWNAKTLSALCQAMIYSDHISQIYHATAPRETTPGAAARLRDQYITAGTTVLERLKTSAFRDLLKRAVDDFNAICRDIPLARVGIVGEIYIKYSAIGNRNILQWLVSQGVEPVMPGLADFFLQEIPNRVFNRRNNLARRDWTLLVDKALYQLIRHWQRGYARIAARFKFNRPGEDIFTKWEAAGKIVNLAAQYGEGWLIPAEFAAFAESGVNNAVSLQPFGCIANHLISKGIERRVRELHPRMNLLFLDLDSGTSEANLLNRLHFIVQNARDELARTTPAQ